MTEQQLPEQIGPYRVVRLLAWGDGGVFLADDPESGGRVWIRILRRESDRSEAVVREARAHTRLRHPHVVAISAVGEHDGQPFIAAEHVDGVTSKQLLADRKDLTLAQRLALIEQISAGVAYLHQAGVVHRQLKPFNIMIGDGDAAKVLYFPMPEPESDLKRQASRLMGTVNYMAPEQVSGQRIDARSDVFSLAAIAYEILSGRPAFPGDISSGVLTRITREPAPPLDGVEAGLAAVVFRGLEKDPDRRYRDAGEMRAALAGVIQTA